MTPRTHRRVHGRHRAPDQPELVGPRCTARYREGSHFWEDTNNNARVAFNPPAGIPRELYIPDLAAQLAQIGSGSTLRHRRARWRLHEVLRGDGRVGVAREAGVRPRLVHLEPLLRQLRPGQLHDRRRNDENIFIGSSNIADGAGRQLWDFKDGTLRGDRPHMLKLYGFY